MKAASEIDSGPCSIDIQKPADFEYEIRETGHWYTHNKHVISHDNVVKGYHIPYESRIILDPKGKVNIRVSGTGM